MNPAERYMSLALSEAEKAWGLTTPNPMVGAVAVKDGEVIGKGYHHRAGCPHAERELLAECGDALRGADVYVTLEPCSTVGRTPACTEELISAGVKRVIVGCEDPNPRHRGRGLEILRAAGIEVESGVLEKECRELNRAFFKWITTNRPFVLLKMAMTLDGKIADSTGESKWITGELARSRVQYLRRWADAVMITGGTLRRDKARLTVREPADWPKKLHRIIATESMSSDELRRYFPDDPDVRTACIGGRADWDRLLTELGSSGITALLLEGGGELAGSALESGIVDAVEFHIAPKLLCGRGSIPVTGGENRPLSEVLKLKNISIERLGEDVLYRGDVERG